jgi:tetratricopeptide (TPR) repeat protein
LRRRLDLESLGLSGDEVLDPDRRLIRCDLEDFRTALRLGELPEAIALLQKGFCTHLRRRPGQEFDDWLTAKREGLRRDLRATAARIWDATHPVGDWRSARDAAEALHALDPHREASLRMVIEARAMTGSTRGAEAALETFLESLPTGRELDQLTQSLMDRVRALSQQVGPRVAMGDPPPLFGRKPDLEASRAMLGRVREGSFEFLLLKGEAGVGKTRLLDEIRREAHLKGFRCIHSRPVELERHIPLNPLIDALSVPAVGRHLRALHSPWKAVLGVLLPHLLEESAPLEVPPIEETSLSRRLYEAFSLLFSHLAAEEPTLLFIDDLQWADATTIAVLQFIQRRWQSGPLGIVASIRPDLVQRGTDIAKYLSESRSQPVTDVELRDLEEEDAEKLVQAVADGSLDPATRLRLCALGGRSPFYLIELTRDYLAGHLQLPELPSDTISIPISIRQLLDPRLETLSKEASAVASYLAVWGRWAPISALTHLCGTTLEACTTHVEELERRRLITIEKGTVRVAHELFRGALYHRLSEARRAYFHRRLAEYLLSTEQPAPGELAVHFARAGERDKAAEFGREAADAALESGAIAEAAHFLQVVTENVTDLGLKAEATGDLAKVLHMNREIVRASPILELAAARLREGENPARALRMDIWRVDGLAEVGATPMPDLLDRLRSIKVAARVAGDWEALALALDSELHLLHRSGKVAAIQQLFREILECADRGDSAAACLANASLAMDVLFGDGVEALDRARSAVRIAESESVARQYLFKAQTRLVLVLIYSGQLLSTEAQGLLRRASAQSRSSGDITLRFYLESNRGVFAMEAGDLDAAEIAFERAAPILEKRAQGTPHLNLLCNRGELCIQRQSYSEGLSWLNRAQLLVSPSSPVYLADLVNAGLGICSLELGCLSEARELEAQALDDPNHWYFDPTLKVDFQSRMLMKRGERVEATEAISRTANTIRSRLPAIWIKLVLLESRLRRRYGASAPSCLQEALRVSESLGLTTRGDQLRNESAYWQRSGRSH